MKTYSELKSLKTYDERLRYLQTYSRIGEETFGHDRYINQEFYTSDLWKGIRNKIILRDEGCDLGLNGYDILDRVIIHHLNPITIDDILNLTPQAIDPEYLVCVSLDTHNAIHYGSTVAPSFIERRPNDTCPWKQAT